MTFSEIQAAIDAAVRANNQRAFINANTVNRSIGVRTALERLAYACGLREPLAEGRSADDLAMLYAVARKQMDRAQGIATGWNDEQPSPRPIPGGLIDDDTAPSASPATTTPQIDFEALLEAARKEAGAMAKYIAEASLADAMGDLEPILEKLARAAVAKVQPASLIVKLPEQAPHALGVVHFKTEEIISLLALGLNVYLHGPAGSGKTTAARKCAEAFKVPFYFAAKVESEYLLLGFKDANGNTVRTQFREAYEHGGVFLFDEMDASASGAIVALNAALANGYCPFPDGTIERHKDFKCIGAGNTVLTGANRLYTGRTALDAASIDRLGFVEFPYDEKLELAIAPDKDWCAHVQAIRAAIARRGLDHLVTPRATIDGGKMVVAGHPWERAEQVTVWKGLDSATVEQVRNEMRRAA